MGQELGTAARAEGAQEREMNVPPEPREEKRPPRTDAPIYAL